MVKKINFQHQKKTMYTEEITTTLRALIGSIEQRGLSATLKLLQHPIVEKADLTAFEKKVFALVEEYMGIKREDILQSRYMHGDTKYAVGLCVYFMSREKTLGQIKKDVFPNKTKTLLSIYSRQISNLSAKSRVDKRIYDIREKIKSQL